MTTDKKLIREIKDHRVTHDFLCVLTQLGVYCHMELLLYTADMMMQEAKNISIVARVAT